ncbi:MAG: thioredoxin [Flavobacteriales bacterium CG_4_10_14_0_2_um_filter_32_8]|nr:MAG: thioredoxin [Flavobacteriales bacterium CG_4_10_14_0_2_um_filter_32_8]PJB15306.1 MAG: thioredoxin [Flavobacteriales bacterium CG_4_9_14_3_um_filter_32_8]
MKYSIVIIAALIGLLVFAFKAPNFDFTKDVAGGIQFNKGTFNEVLQQAKKENKLIFIDIYASWCGPCKRLKSGTFSDVEVGKLYNQKFINAAFDGEKGEGIILAQKYGVRSYPTLLFVDSNGNIVVRTGGYHNPDEFIELGKTVAKK